MSRKKGRAVAVVAQRDSAAVGASAAVGTSYAPVHRQQQVVSSFGNYQIPYTPQYIADWLYQSLLDTVRVLESIMGGGELRCHRASTRGWCWPSDVVLGNALGKPS